MKCLKCGRGSKKGELVYAVYETRNDGRVPTSSQFSAGFIHVECPFGVVVHDFGSDSHHPVEGGEAAMRYVQEHLKEQPDD